jgi:hypothetical protein
VDKTNSIFNSEWWLNAVCENGNYEIIALESGINLPIYIVKKWGMKFILMPPFTPWYNLNISYENGMKEANKLSYDKDIISEIIDKMPKADYVQLALSPETTNWLPFYWKGFEQTTAYTYLINTNKPLEQLFTEIGKKKNNVHKADKLGFTVFEDDNIDFFYSNYIKTLQNSPNSVIYPKRILNAIYNNAKEQQSGKIISVKDDKNNTLASTLYVWDHQYLYYLISVRNTDFTENCAVSKVVWEGIQLAHEKQLTFNFEGSMVEPIEHFFRSFGAKQTPYFKLKKFNSELLRVGNSFLKKL